MGRLTFTPPARLRAMAPSKIRGNMRIASDVGAINLAQGRPELATADELKRAAIEAIEAGHNQYSVTWGLRELRETVAEMLRARYGVETDPEGEITITCGVTEAIVAALLALVEPGDEVLVVEPAHENYVPAILFAGGVPRYLCLEPPDFELSPEALEEAVTDRTRALILNTPNNPSGKVFTREELEAILRVAERTGTYVVTDEIYDRLLYPPHEHVSPASVAKDPAAVVTTGGISKIYAATGWRLGYVAAEPEISSAIRTVHEYLTICAPTPFQHAAVTALGFPESYYEDLVRSFEQRRDRFLERLREAGFDPFVPNGAYYVLAGYERWGFPGDVDAFTKHLITEGGVATVPGTAFYLGHPEVGERVVRFAFARDPEVLEDAGRRLKDCFEETRS